MTAALRNLCQERDPLRIGGVPSPALPGERHGRDVDACGVLGPQDSAPCCAEHFPDLGVQHIEGPLLDAEAYCDGRACIHAHLHVWWRGPDDADLGTAYFCARFDRGAGGCGFGLAELKEAGRDDMNLPPEDRVRGDLDACGMDRSVLVEIGRRLEPQERRTPADGRALDVVRLRLLDRCEYV